eukprot:tig00000622_g2626.t1
MALLQVLPGIASIPAGVGPYDPLAFNNVTEFFLRESVLYANKDDITQLGYDFFWLSFGFHAAGMLLYFLMTIFFGKGRRAVYILQVAICAIGVITYFAMARNQGNVGLKNDASTGVRTFYWARYAQWAFTYPLIIFTLAILAGQAQIETTVIAIAASLFYVATRLLGALSQSSSRWGWFGFSCGAAVLTFLTLWGNIRRAAFVKGKKNGDIYTYALFLITVLNFTYPTIWVIGEGTRAITVDAEILLYAIFDVIQQGVFGFVVLMSETIAALPTGSAAIAAPYGYGQSAL